MGGASNPQGLRVCIGGDQTLRVCGYAASLWVLSCVKVIHHSNVFSPPSICTPARYTTHTPSDTWSPGMASSPAPPLPPRLPTHGLSLPYHMVPHGQPVLAGHLTVLLEELGVPVPQQEQWEKWGEEGEGADGEGGQSRLVPCPATKRAYCMPQPPPSPLAPTKHNMQHGPLTLLINPSCLLPAITAASTPVRLRGPPASNTTWPPSPDVTYPLTPCVCTTHCDICR